MFFQFKASHFCLFFSEKGRKKVSLNCFWCFFSGIVPRAKENTTVIKKDSVFLLRKQLSPQAMRLLMTYAQGAYPSTFPTKPPVLHSQGHIPFRLSATTCSSWTGTSHTAVLKPQMICTGLDALISSFMAWRLCIHFRYRGEKVELFCIKECCQQSNFGEELSLKSL